MCTSWVIQSAAASLEDGARARPATRPNSTRSNGVVILRPFNRRRIAASMPSRRHSPSSTSVPPSGRDPTNTRSKPAVALNADAGSSSRDSDAISRLTWATSTWSARPKLNKILVREVRAALSHSLWTSCRYGTWLPFRLRRLISRKNTSQTVTA
jgi:hypothetical protein